MALTNEQRATLEQAAAIGDAVAGEQRIAASVQRTVEAVAALMLAADRARRATTDEALADAMVEVRRLSGQVLGDMQRLAPKLAGLAALAGPQTVASLEAVRAVADAVLPPDDDGDGQGGEG